LKVIHTLSAPTATGKTHALSVTIQRSSRSIIATPNKAVSKETAKTFSDAGFSVLQISRDTHPNCRQALQHAIDADRHEVIIVHHSVAMRRLEGTGHYDLYIDEVPSVFETEFLRASNEHFQKIVVPFFKEATISDSPFFYEIAPNPQLAEFMASLNRHEALVPSDDMRVVLHAIQSADYEVLLRAASWKSYIELCQHDPEKAGRKLLEFRIIMKPSALENYRSVTVLGANFHNSEMFYAWKNKVTFVENLQMKSLLRELPEQKKGLVNIRYLSEGLDSRAALDKIGYQYFVDKAAAAFGEMFPDVPHIFTLSKPKDEFHRSSGEFAWPYERKGHGIRLDPSAKGENKFSDINVGIHLAPINPSTEEYNFRRQYLSMDSEAVKLAIFYEGQYQFFSRLSIRDYSSTKPVFMFTLDRKSADVLYAFYAEQCAAEPQFFDIGIEELRLERKKPKSAAERQASCQSRKRNIENLEITAKFQYDDFRLRLWEQADCKKPIEETLSWTELTAFMRNASKTLVVKAKKKCPQFREGYFTNPNDHRLVSNIITSKLLQIDIDLAKISPLKLSYFLRKHNISHIIMNSFSSTDERVRLHLLIPLTRAVCADDYKKLFNLICTDITVEFGDDFEMDKQIKSLNQKLNMPCVSEFGENIFIESVVWNELSDYATSFLDVERYLRRILPDVNRSTTLSAHTSTSVAINIGDIESIIQKWAVAPDLGKGDHSFYQAGVDLKKLGCSFDEVFRVLEQNCNRFGHGKHRDALRAAKSIFSRTGARFHFVQPTSAQIENAKSTFDTMPDKKVTATVESFFHSE
jgi:hypothetical protein